MAVRQIQKRRQKRTTTMKVSSASAAALRYMAGDNGCSVTDLMERALLSYLEASGYDPGPAIPKRDDNRGRPGPTRHEALAKIAAQPTTGPVAIPTRLTPEAGDCIDAFSSDSGQPMGTIAERAIRFFVKRQGKPFERELCDLHGPKLRKQALATIERELGQHHIRAA